jgi:hypothetical protein
MRLINVKTLKLESFFDKAVPPYAILSHRWGPEELTYQDMRAGPSSSARSKLGFAKVRGVCDLVCDRFYDAAPYECDYVWVDTCCIDKSSSAELSEAINSMFEWYRKAKICFAFLDDVTADGRRPMSKSLWFTRGWTLQELIAPDDVVFYDGTWNRIGDRTGMSGELTEVTGVPAALLARRCSPIRAGKLLDTYSVAAKMSWASRRRTTRVEDEAYCLMGLFGVHMPLIYGEGSKALRRLQEAIVRETQDMSILVHDSIYALAHDVSCFRLSGDVELGPRANAVESLGVAIVNQELELTTLTCPARLVFNQQLKIDAAVCSLALLNCSFAGDHLSRPALLYHHAGDDPNMNIVNRPWVWQVFRISPGDETERVYDGDSFECR